MIPELKTLIAIAREGSFAAAGQKTGLTQAAVSARIQRLEEALGFALFDRSGRSARLNPRGHETLARARELVRLHDELGSPEAGIAAGESVSIGAIASVQRARLPDALARFHRQEPLARSRVVPGVSRDLLDHVDAGELDLALVIRPPFALQRDLRWTALASEPFCLLVPRAVAGDDWSRLLADGPFIRYDHTSFGGRQVDRFLRERQLAVRQVAELDELEAIVRLVANRVGVALLPESGGLPKLPAGVRRIDLGAATFHRDIGLVHRPVEQMSPAALRLARLVCEAYGVVMPAELPRSPPSPRPPRACRTR